MTMTKCSLNNSLALAGLCLRLALLLNAEVDTSCPGPTRYYDQVGCTPVFETPGDKCPKRYNCDHLKDRSRGKCFVNGHSYEIGEMLREEDRDPCDLSCFCTEDYSGLPTFDCALVECLDRPDPGCYMKRNATNCCPGPQICLEEGMEPPTCLVDGKIYKDGEYFEPAGEPGKQCYCGEGYTGENIEPFCIRPRGIICDNMLRSVPDVGKNCIPIRWGKQSAETICNVTWKCQNNQDVVIKSDAKSANDEPADPDMLCIFGSLKMRVGEKLNPTSDYICTCEKCICEVPPLPTCQILSDEECNAMKHPKIEES